LQAGARRRSLAELLMLQEFLHQLLRVHAPYAARESRALQPPKP
jgi:hypothetical protein